MAEEKRISAGLSHHQTFFFLEIEMIEREKIRFFHTIELLQFVFPNFSLKDQLGFFLGPRNTGKFHFRAFFKAFFMFLLTM